MSPDQSAALADDTASHVTPTPATSPGPLKAPYRRLVWVTELLMRRGLAPTQIQAAKRPLALRQAQKPPRWMTRPGDRTVTTREVKVQGRGGPFTVRLYLPTGLRPGQPAILYLHGGGFIFGGLDGCDYLTRGLASRTGLLVASVEYRLAPECPHPGPLDDCEDALRWLVETAPEGCDPSRIAVGGDSAGGNLAAALALRVRDSGGPAICHQTLVYPFLDATITAQAWMTFAGAGVDAAAGREMVELYAPHHDPMDPSLSPLHAPDLSGLPPTHVVTASHDTLVDDGVRYVERLRGAGVPTVHRQYTRVPHGFISMPRLGPEADHALDLIAAEMSAALGSA